MDYRNLPPGLERRLAYSYHIRINEPLISVRSNNRTFRIPERRSRNWRNNRLYFGSIRTNIERDTDVRTFYTRVDLYDNYINEQLDTEIPNGDLSELTNELANLIIENQQREETESIQESLPDLESDTEIDENVISGTRLLNSPIISDNYHDWPHRPSTPLLRPLEPPGLENFRGMFNHRENFNFNNLIDIEKGVISKNLLEKSKVVYYGEGRGLRAQVPSPNDEPSCPTQHENSVGLDSLCCICRENFEYIDITRQLVCEHIFHINCIDTWFTKNKTCPECRYEI
jgi:hypothetical protein